MCFDSRTNIHWALNFDIPTNEFYMFHQIDGGFYWISNHIQVNYKGYFFHFIHLSHLYFYSKPLARLGFTEDDVMDRQDSFLPDTILSQAKSKIIQYRALLTLSGHTEISLSALVPNLQTICQPSKQSGAFALSCPTRQRHLYH